MWITVIIVAALGLGLYAVIIEPQLRLRVTKYDLPLFKDKDLARPLKIVVLSDIHACKPWMSAAHIARIVKRANALSPDIIMLLGDYETGIHKPFCLGFLKPEEWAPPLGALKAPHGIYAVLGNHDWSEDLEGSRRALLKEHITVLENQSSRVSVGGNNHLWVAGLADQYSDDGKLHGPGRRDDLRATLEQVEQDGRPIILLAHEPDIFPQVPDGVSLVLSGHTHGGQVLLPFIGAIKVPSLHGKRFVYGRHDEGSKTLIVSAGLGCSQLPIRFRCAPEIVEINLT
ncbi:metallophosphoesterase [Rhodobacteraceae bacterium RKSG542]|nr:metallophosphoesterase [Pseudovibrio flavus]